MFKNKKIIALTLARGGSKGIHRKNIRTMAGKPLIAFTIETALNCRYLDKIVVSTDDKEIAEIAKKWGAEVPFMRPKRLAQDNSPAMGAILHAINWFERKKEYFDILVLLDPTSPLRETADIDKCLKLLINHKKAKAIVSIARLESLHPEFNVVLNRHGFIRKPDGRTEFRVLRRQDLKDIYFFDGTIYASYIDTFKDKKTFYHQLTLGYVVPRFKSFEIDDPCDLVIVEALIKAKKKNQL